MDADDDTDDNTYDVNDDVLFTIHIQTLGCPGMLSSPEPWQRLSSSRCAGPQLLPSRRGPASCTAKGWNHYDLPSNLRQGKPGKAGS